MQRDRSFLTLSGRRGFWLAPALALLFGACASYPDVAELEQLKKREPVKPFFSELLAQEYELLAITEADYRGDTAAARFYANKGNLAAQGQDVAPESPTGAAGQQEAHDRLVAYKGQELAIIAPAFLARAQATYDCWVEESRQGDSEDNLALCRDGFDLAVASLETQQPPVPVGELTPDFTLFFATSSRRLPDNAAAVIGEIVDIIGAGDARGVRLAGFSDRAGSAEGNLRLSGERARSVERALVEAGLPPNMLSTEAFGETNLLVETADGVAEARNRRVEIYLIR